VTAETGERVFVPPSLLAHNALNEEYAVWCRAMLSKDKKQGKLGWKALCLKQMEE
jgi:hypothetical protein